MKSFSAEPVLSQLKDFQRATAEHVFDRFYGAKPTNRFLVADEVGLGKTLVAKGVIAKTVEHLWNDVKRIDIIYVCSNAQIARQNLRRLHVGEQEHFELADRITMLPAVAHKLHEKRLNIISFTPGTSFDLTRGGGEVRERALLRLLLKRAWGGQRFTSRGSMRVFQGGVRSLERFRTTFNDIRKQYGRTLDAHLVRRFRDALREHDVSASRGERMRERFHELCDLYKKERPVTGWTWPERHKRNRFIGDLRDLLAKACLEALEPDLIILDEFQRFKHLLVDPESEEASPASELAHELFSYVDDANNARTKVLLLSATPYKMMTTQLEDEDHHEDLVATVDFLFEHRDKENSALRRGLRDLRQGLTQVTRDGGESALLAKSGVEKVLRHVMVRTERLASTENRSGMLKEATCEGMSLSPKEIERYVGASRLARHLKAPDPLEYWKSSPYLVNFMDEYKMRDLIEEAAEAGNPELMRLVSVAGTLDWSAVRRFQKLEIDNSRMQWLMEHTLNKGAWKLLWMPPSLPYTVPQGPFAAEQLQGLTKQLIFSSWAMVPKAVATLMSYEAERRMVTASGSPKYLNHSEARTNHARPLEFTKTNERLTGMPVFALLYPSFVLAQEGDPLRLAAEKGGQPVPVDEAVTLVAGRLEKRLEEVLEHVDESSDLAVPTEGRIDERWYWAAPLWFDWLEDDSRAEQFFNPLSVVRDGFIRHDPAAGGTGFDEHLREARRFATKDYPEDLGRIPPDLVEVLAKVALAGPGSVFARALSRISGRGLDDLEVRRAACAPAWSFRALFNSPEVTELIRHLHPEDTPYWRKTLDYALNGNLQAVMDEYAHALIGAGGHLDTGTDDALAGISQVMAKTVSLRTVTLGATNVKIAGEKVELERNSRLRVHFALRLSEEKSDDGSAPRVSDVRDAFNSPFWPFILVTTSVGQEGLDFHQFCHSIVHWNLPANPVDLEQREGRIHRFKGHAVRRNVAASYGSVGRHASGDPWEEMFSAAAKDRPEGSTDIIPYWIFTGPAKIERYVPALPLSRDRSRAESLKKAVAAYRLAFGQPRQDDLLAYLAQHLEPEELTKLGSSLAIDLSPSKEKVLIAPTT